MLAAETPLRGAALLLALSLLTQGRPQAAAPLPPGEAARPPSPAPPAWPRPPAPPLPGREGGDAREEEAAEAEEGDELFPGVEPQALAAVLLRALDRSGHESPDKRRAPAEEPGRSQSRSAGEAAGGESGPPPLGELQAILQELRAFSPRPRGDRDRARAPALRELEEELGGRRREPPPRREPWAGAGKLRRQQQLEHQLLRRRYEELAESRRQAQEARQAAAEEERLADLASDLLLQYLLRGRGAGETGQEEEEGADRARSSPLLFEDEEGDGAQDKRSDEAGEEGLEPAAIDQLIELASQLHLPAQDVLDVISQAGRPRSAQDEEEEEEETRGAPPAAAPAPPRHPAAPWRRPPRPDEADWNEVLPPPPRRFPPPPAPVSNFIQPRAFPPARPRLSRPPLQEEAAAAASRARDEELENYLEHVLLERGPPFP